MTEEIEVRVPRKMEARVTDDIEAEVATDIEVEVEVHVTESSLTATARIQHAVPDRGRARELFERLAVLPQGDAERLRIRGELVELHLPLV